MKADKRSFVDLVNALLIALDKKLITLDEARREFFNAIIIWRTT